MDATLPFEDVMSRVSQRNNAITTLRGEGSITIESPEGAQSGSFTLDIHKPDSLRLQLRGPFGIRIGTLAIAPGSFVYYDSRENVAVTGRPDRGLIASTLRIAMDVDEIIRALTGEFAVSTTADSLIRFYPREDEFVLAYREEKLLKEVHIDGESFCVSSYREVSADGSSPFAAFASRFTDEEPLTMPTILRMVFPIERRSVSIAYDDVELNGESSCQFSIPDDARIVRR